jgi:YebC/PmpR family DNA-binding regulatory protein
MSGHSKWSTIKHKKGAADAKRGKMFTVLARAVTMAAKEGGGDIDVNFSLRLAVEKAKRANMPKDNIERAIKRGTGEDKDATTFEKLIYECYAPHGIAMIVEAVTDNSNRTIADLRHLLNKSGGNIGETGSVAWQFSQKSYFAFSAEDRDEDEIYMLAADAGADDVGFSEDVIEIYGEPTDFKKISDQLRLAGIKTEEADLRMFPNQEIELDVDKTMSVMKLIDSLEDLDDINQVDSNLTITDEALEKLVELG